MIKRLLVSFCLFLAFTSFAQEGTSSPYSYYGIGESRFKGTVENRSMGGLSVLPDSIHLNIENPAFYPNLKYTTMSLGGSYSTTKLESNTDKEKARRTTLDYLAVGIPMGKFAAGFGLMPYSSVGYKIENVPSADVPQRRRYTGSGGVNKAFLGAGYQITKAFSVGAEFGYYFGDIETNSLTEIDTVQYGTRELNESRVSGAGFNAGLSYSSRIGKKLLFTASAVYSPETKMTFKNERTISLVQFVNSGYSIVETDTIPKNDIKIMVPSKLSFGAGIGEVKKWMVGTQFTVSTRNSLTNRFDDISNSEFRNGFKYSLGGYYIPNFTSFSDYWKRVVYRGGFKYEETGLVVNDKAIKDVGMTLGVGLPLTGTFSNINVGLEYGKRGTKDAGLVEENYLNFTVGLSFSDRWFVKRKYD